MRDTIELEGRDVPVALITAQGRIPKVAKRKGVYYVAQSLAGNFKGDLDNPRAQRYLSKFGFHRQLRLAGCKAGDPVEINGVRLKWKYPSKAFEESKLNWPSGFAKWHTRIDGIKRLEPIETPDPTVGLSRSEVQARVDDLTPAVLGRLVAGRR